VTGTPLTPAHLSYMTKSSQSHRPPAMIQELWFPSKKVLPINEYSHEDELPNRDVMPPKPKKLTPIFSKKRSEIMQQNTNNNINMTSSSLNFDEEQQVVQVKKPKKKNMTTTTSQRVENAAGAGDINKPKKLKKKSINKVNSSQRDVNDEESFAAESMNTPKTPKSKLDSIWDPEQLAPKLGEASNGNLSTIGEEFAPLKMSRTKSYLGGKVAKLNDEHISNLSQREATNQSITYKRKQKSDMNSNDNAGLVDEFNKALSSNGSFNNA
jgi:hypothetical protein